MERFVHIGLKRLEGRPFELVRLAQSANGLHDHAFMELVVVESGSGVHLTETGAYELRQGDYFAIPPGMIHGYGPCRGMRISNLLFEDAALFARFPELSDIEGYRSLFHLEPSLRDADSFSARMTLSRPKLDFLVAELDGLQAELTGWASGRTEDRIRAWSTVLRIVAGAAAAFGTRRDLPSENLLSMERALDMIERALDGGGAAALRPARIAAAVGMSRAAFYRKFTQTFGAAPAAHIEALRLERAKQVLLKAGSRVKEAAAAAGYEDPNHFSRVFKARTGTTPGEWRRGR